MQTQINIGIRLRILWLAIFVVLLTGCATRERGLDHVVYWYDPESYYSGGISHAQRGPADSLADRGWREVQQGRYQTAVIELDRAVELAESSTVIDDTFLADVYLRRGIAYWYLGDVETAIENYTRSIERNPNDWRGYFHRWQARRRIEDSAGAEHDRQAGLRLKPEVFKRNYDFRYGVI